jgi:imidazolonepropionase-like amidohydrolase
MKFSNLLMRLIAASLAALAFAAPAFASPTHVAEELSIVQNGELVGHVHASGNQARILVDYLVDNNGRGPRHREEVLIGPGGVPVRYTVRGQSLMGAAVEESYVWENGRAIWRSQADEGEVAAPTPPLYVVNDNSPYTLAVYARALLKTPGKMLETLPGGRMRLERVRSHTVVQGGQALSVTIYRLDGIDLSPSYLMLDQQEGLFATLGTGSLAVRKGYEEQVPILLELATELAVERARAIQREVAHHAPGSVSIRNVRIFDSEKGDVSGLSTILVEGGRIMSVTPWDETAPTGAAEITVDGEGGVMVPGLHDMHAHNSFQSGLFYLAAGVTTTRDMGSVNDTLPQIVAQTEQREIAGPRIVANGFIEGRSPFSARHGIVVDSEEEGLAAVRWYAARGYHQIKIYNSMNPQWVPALAAEARRHGMGVTGHVPAFTTADAMIEAGYDEIAHLNQLMLGWLIEPGEDTRTPLRLTAMARAAELDLEAPEVRNTIALMQARGTALDSTIVILERLMLSRAGEVAEGDAAYLDHMPIGYQRYRRRTFVPLDSEAEDVRYRTAFVRLLDTIGLLDRSGITLLPGTDDPTGFTVHRELELYHKAGIPAARVLQIATLGMARYMDRDREFGSIAPGKHADFFLIAGDPTEDISAIRHARMVFKGDQIYYPSAIYGALGIRPFAEGPRLSKIGAATE